MDDKEEGKLLSNIEFIKDKISCLPCQKHADKLNKITIFLAILAALTLGGTAFRIL